MSREPTGALAHLQQEIRAEAAALPEMPTAPPCALGIAAPLALDHPQRLNYTLDDFMHVHNDEFVELAYRCLLKRPADAVGQLHALQRLAAGDSKIAILGDLRASEEGRGYGVHVAGLAARYRFWRLTRLPLVGALIERAALVWNLPEIAREQRRLGQALAQQNAGAEIAGLATEVARLREELAALRARRDDPPAE
ncbi:MAG TPA: hypothetical protein VLF18_02935 [Tahibacter sp.]|uniref:hypothetical protein n=1 Tax=Tahibacter sp. TaxID=2056211 RepID=UPI002B5F4EAF|nr:hypothetical protein [Tahibacter sp.]HSX59134.1 hypothetical protein [Tahibacter sp.]